MTLITGLPTNKANVRKLFKIYFKNYIYNYIFMCICNIAFYCLIIYQFLIFEIICNNKFMV